MRTVVGSVGLALALNVVAATVYVSPDGCGNGDGSSATDAVAFRAAVLSGQSAGTTVQFADGVYLISETMVINGITVLGNEDDPSRVVLNAAENVRIAMLSGAAPRISGFTMNGNGTVEGSGGAINAAEAGAAGMIENCVIRDFKATGDGGGVLLGDATISKCTIANCSVGSYPNSGGAICGAPFNTSKKGFVRDCFIYDCVNTSGWAYGPAIALCSSVLRTRVENCRMKSGEGSALFLCGGAYNCLFVRNSGGINVAKSTACYNCTFVNNNSGQECNSTAYNCLITGGYSGVNNSASYYNCLTTTTTANGCFSADPLLTEDFRLGEGSPCLNAGNNDYVQSAMEGTDYSGATDRILNDFVDVGCYEREALPSEYSAVLSDLEQTVDLGADARVDVTVKLAAIGSRFRCVCDFGDGSAAVEVEHVVTRVPDQFSVTHAYGNVGFHTVSVTVYAENGAVVAEQQQERAVLVLFPEAADFYVAPDGDDTADGCSAATAKRTLSLVLSAVKDGSTVHLLPGTHVFSESGNVTKAVTVTGDGATREDVVITLPEGETAVTPLVVNNAAALVRNLSFVGITNTVVGGTAVRLHQGMVSNCVFRLCSVLGGACAVYGGGRGQSTVTDCTVTDNETLWDGVINLATVTDCRIVNNRVLQSTGGPATALNRCKAYRCVIADNSTVGGGGTALNQCDAAYDCLIAGNRSARGAAVCNTTLYNCTVVDNRTDSGVSAGLLSSQAYNCIFNGNLNNAGLAVNGDDDDATRFRNCVLEADSAPASRMDGDCSFADPCLDRNYRLRSSSPDVYKVSVVGEATGAYFPDSANRRTDLTGETPRLFAKGENRGKISLGCYQYVKPGSLCLIVR